MDFKIKHYNSEHFTYVLDILSEDEKKILGKKRKESLRKVLKDYDNNKKEEKGNVNLGNKLLSNSAKEYIPSWKKNEPNNNQDILTFQKHKSSYDNHRVQYDNLFSENMNWDNFQKNLMQEYIKANKLSFDDSTKLRFSDTHENIDINSFKSFQGYVFNPVMLKDNPPVEKEKKKNKYNKFGVNKYSAYNKEKEKKKEEWRNQNLITPFTKLNINNANKYDIHQKSKINYQDY